MTVPPLRVLFLRLPDAPSLVVALAQAGLVARAEGAQGIAVTIGGTAIAVRIVDAPAPRDLLEEAAAHGRGQGTPRLIEAHAAHAELRVTASTEGSGVDRLRALTQAGAALCSAPGALALFFEPGRALTDAGEAARRLIANPAPLPLDLWVGLRSFELADARGWFLDTLGMAELSLPDLEAYAGDGPAVDEVARWLRMVSLHLAEQELPLSGGQTIDGPDEEPWIAIEDSATAPPQRPVLRFVPLAVHQRERR